MDREGFVITASRIGRRLCDLAIRDEGRTNWLGLTPVQVPGGYQRLERPLGPDFYSGVSGVAYFLCRLHRLMGDRSLKKVAEGATSLAYAERARIPRPIQISFYSGHVGIAFTLVEFGETFSSRRAIRDGLAMIKRLAGADLADSPPDALLGLAGSIAPLLDLYGRYTEDWILDLALKLGHHLVDSARRRDCGWSWKPFGPVSEFHRDDLTGFAHGVSGIAWSLLELYAATGERTFLLAAEEGFRYERQWYNPEVENWLDLRYMPGPDGDENHGHIYQIQWCHGAVGIGLTRLRAYRLLGRTLYRDEAEASLRTTMRDIQKYPKNWQPNYSLCHGMAGNTELLIEAIESLSDDRWWATATHVGRLGIEQFDRPGASWPGSLGPTELPGLLTGIAGTGLFYLRLHNPAITSSILLVQPRAALKLGHTRPAEDK